MAKTDAKLGQRIHEHLKTLGIENPIDFANVKDFGVTSLEAVMSNVCKQIGLSATDPSTEGTPHRLAKMYKKELCWGLDYENFPACLITPNEGHVDGILCERNIAVKSLCEHHFMPVIGVAHIAYIPKDKLLGLSKFNRIVEFFSRRPQLQERLGEQILATLKLLLETEDVAVIVDAEHLCVKFRGIEDCGSSTITSLMSGKFRTEASARLELLSLIRSK